MAGFEGPPTNMPCALSKTGVSTDVHVTRLFNAHLNKRETPCNIKRVSLKRQLRVYTEAGCVFFEKARHLTSLNSAHLCCALS